MVCLEALGRGDANQSLPGWCANTQPSLSCRPMSFVDCEAPGFQGCGTNKDPSREDLCNSAPLILEHGTGRYLRQFPQHGVVRLSVLDLEGVKTMRAAARDAPLRSPRLHTRQPGERGSFPHGESSITHVCTAHISAWLPTLFASPSLPLCALQPVQNSLRWS